jgi:hypothetical protein
MRKANGTGHFKFSLHGHEAAWRYLYCVAAAMHPRRRALPIGVYHGRFMNESSRRYWILVILQCNCGTAILVRVRDDCPVPIGIRECDIFRQCEPFHWFSLVAAKIAAEI